MAQQHMSKVKAGQLLKAEPGFQLYQILIEDGSVAVGGYDLVTAAFNPYGVGIRISRGCEYVGGPLQQPAQVTLTHEDFQTLIASYRAFERAEKKRMASAPSDDFEPFLDLLS